MTDEVTVFACSRGKVSPDPPVKIRLEIKREDLDVIVKKAKSLNDGDTAKDLMERVLENFADRLRDE